ncbi:PENTATRICOPEPTIDE REPEAT 596 [Perilla frutescens var. hirtella]|uniref:PENTATRICOPEPTIDE REPEAT 596 n=1 Tax=Perilla frutescens var. hirtella TaxID=608512 RepID=A0AAD4P7J7_PERFH|nr:PENTATRICOPEPTIDE REPEAT 596 [Perilla frutescens var. hirtella]
MTEAIPVSPALTVSEALDKWIEAGNEVTRADILQSMIYLRQRKMFTKALELLKWPESIKHLEYSDSYYASHVDLIARVHGISKAEIYLQQIPECSRNEEVYQALLANCVSTLSCRKAEALFDKMKKLFHLTSLSCNLLLLLYKKTDRKKIAGVLLLMEEENIKPSLLTYQILIEVKGQFKDFRGMERILERMEFEGVEPDTRFQATLARNYADAGLRDKAEAVLKDMEGGDITKNLSVCRFLLPVYASLGRGDEVRRIWKVCESNPQVEQCMAAIEAWGHLKSLEEAEAVFDIMSKNLKRLSSRHYDALLYVYADHKEVAKGEDLMRRMLESGVTPQPGFWDALVKLYVGAGEVEKADAVLEHALTQRRGRLYAASFLTILDQYSKRGDVHNAEKIFFKMRQAGYFSRMRVYQSLLNAYINAKAPAYGFIERMKGDDFVPNQSLAALLAQAVAFR